MRQRRKRDECWALWYHSCLLRTAANLATDRHRQLVRTLDRLGFESIPDDSGDFTKLQVEAAQEIGVIRTKMILDAPGEIETYHWRPLQIALCLLAGILAKYETLRRDDRSFQDDEIDAYGRQHAGFVKGLHDLRDSLLHQRYEDMPTQAGFVAKFAGGQRSRIVELLLEGRSVYEGYVRRMGRSLRGRERALPILNDADLRAGGAGEFLWRGSNGDSLLKLGFARLVGGFGRTMKHCSEFLHLTMIVGRQTDTTDGDGNDSGRLQRGR